MNWPLMKMNAVSDSSKYNFATCIKKNILFAADRTSCYLVTLNLSRPVFRHHIKMSGEKIFVFNFRFKNCHLYEYCPCMTFTIQKLGKLKYKANSYGASLLKNFKKLWMHFSKTITIFITTIWSRVLLQFVSNLQHSSCKPNIKRIFISIDMISFCVRDLKNDFVKGL